MGSAGPKWGSSVVYGSFQFFDPKDQDLVAASFSKSASEYAEFDNARSWAAKIRNVEERNKTLSAIQLREDAIREAAKRHESPAR